MKVLRVAVCDDNPLVSSTIESMLMEYAKQTSLRISCDLYDNSIRLQKTLPLKNYDLYLLDIELPDIKGIDLAKSIRTYDIKCFIVFITSFSEYMPEVFEINTFDYLLKPIDQNRLFGVLNRIIALLDMDDHRFSFISQNTTQTVSKKEIVYFEKQGRYVYLNHLFGTYKIITSTNDLLDNLDNSFVQIHTSYIINLKYLVRMTHDRAFLRYPKNDKTAENTLIDLPVSRKFRDSCREQAATFMRGKF